MTARPAQRSEGGPLTQPVGARGEGLPGEGETDTGRHESLALSLAALLGLSPDEVEQLLDDLHGELLDDLGPEERAASPDGMRDAFERGLQLGLLVGLGSGTDSPSPAGD